MVEAADRKDIEYQACDKMRNVLGYGRLSMSLSKVDHAKGLVYAA